MAATNTHHHRPSPVGVALELFWFLVTAAVALTAALIVVAGSEVIDAPVVRYVVVALLALFAARSWHLHRHRSEMQRNANYRHDRERRGF